MEVATTLDHLVSVRLRQRDNERADELSAEAGRIVDAAVEEVSPDRIPILRHRAEALLGLGRSSEAESILEQSLSLGDEVLAPDHWQTAAPRAALGRLLADRQERVPAEGLLTAAYEVLREGRGEEDPETQRAREELYELYHEWGRPEDAARYRSPEEGRR